MRLKVNISYILFLIFFYIFIFEQLLERYFFLLRYLDEMTALIAVPIFLRNVIKEGGKIYKGKEKWWLFVWFFAFVGFMGNIIYQYQPFLKIALPDMFLCLKFWLAIYTGKCIFSNLNISRFASKIYFHIRLVTWLFIVLTILDQLFHIFKATVRYGMRATQLFYDHPTYFAAVCALLISILLAVRPYIKKCDRYFFILLILMCTTLRSKAFGAALAFIFVYYVVLLRGKKINLGTLLFLASIVLVIAWGQIEYYFFSEIQNDSARYQLMDKAFRIANDHFPFGSGFGTFASHFSSVIYSPLYYIYNISTVYGLKNGETFFISDSFWPMILGQTGWLGLFFWVIALVCLIICIQKMKKHYPSYNAAGMCIFLYLLISSAAESAFVNPAAIPLAVWLGVLLREPGEKGRVGERRIFNDSKNHSLLLVWRK